MASSTTGLSTTSPTTSWSLTTSTTGWGSSCASILQSSSILQSTAPLSSGFVDGTGHPMTVLNDSTWGITYGLCEQFCNANVIPMDFNFLTFSSAMTNYFLPWLSLCAQLPYETGDQWSNVMSFFLAVGSPALITYSLTITILNRYRVRTRFNELYNKAQRQSVQARYGSYAERIRCVQYLLQEAQQVPLRASQERGWLSSLVVAPENQKWWKDVKDRLSSTRRGVTPSLVAQILLAAIAYLFTVGASFNSTTLGDPSTALQISAGSLWLWLIPVILGWVTVGTQFSPDTIEQALTSDEAHRALEPPLQTGNTSEPLAQKGIVPRSGLSPQPHRVQTVVGQFDVPPHKNLELPTWLGADISGDERIKGPIYNYARPFTWWKLASSMEDALSNTLDKIDAGHACGADPNVPGVSWNSTGKAEANLSGDSHKTSLYCGLATRPIHAYPRWKEIPGSVWKHMLAASVMAIFVQWGTTGPSILIAYFTPTIGVGCRTGAYLFYGGLGTLVWILLGASMLLSHAAMLLYQRVHIRNPSIRFRPGSSSGAINNFNPNPPQPNRYVRTWGHATLCAAAVSLRYLGKIIAIANALWLIVSTLLEYIGAYDNCWCKGDVLGLGKSDGWVVLFKTTKDLAEAAQPYWDGGVIGGIVVCSISYAFFWLGSRNLGRAGA